MMKTLLKGNRGITLVEVMVVLVVIAIGIIPIAVVQSHSSRDVVKSGQRTAALNVAQNQMERIKSLGFTAAASDSGSAGPYNWRAIVTNQSLGLNRVTVTVSWMEGANASTLQVDNLLSTR
jgi:prepilin-type N-terminal cleavage/methylation domain-containing protein